MNLMRKFCGYVFALCTICCIMLLPGMKVQAVDMTPVNLNEEFTDVFYDADEVHYYSFTVDKPGRFYVYLKPKDTTLDTGEGWKVVLYDYDYGYQLYYYYGWGSFPSCAFRPGKKFYVAVGIYDKYDAPLGQYISMKVCFEETNTWEAEYNDSYSSANNIKPNTMYYGNLYEGEDQDYFRYKVENSGNQTLTFSPVNMSGDPKDGWKIEIYDASNNELLKSWSYVKLKTSLPVMNFKKGTTLLIKISATYQGTYSPVFQDYCFEIKEKKSSYWEGEDRQTESSWNGYRNGATKLSFNRKYNGVLWTASDQDLFKLVLPKDGTTTIVFNPNEVSNNLGYGYKICIKNSAGNDIMESEYVKTKISKKYYLKKGTYYVHICAQYAYSSYAPVNKIYTLSTTYKAYTPAQVTGLKAKKTVVSWKKQKDAEGYEVCYSKKKNFKGATVQKTTKGSLKLSDLKKGTTYYVRVRAYKTAADNTVVYGKWSSSVTVKK